MRVDLYHGNYKYIGGIVGYGSTRVYVKNSYSLVNSAPLVGYKVGSEDQSCYYIPELGGSTNGSASELSIKNAFNKNSYVGWDFDTVWDIEEGNTTPYLRWAGPTSFLYKSNYTNLLNN